MITVCWWRQRRKALLDQQPMDFTTSKGTPLNRYSSIAPIWMPWPLRGSRPSSAATKLMCLRNSVQASAWRPLGCLQVKRGWSGGGLLMERWLARVAWGSTTLSWAAQNTSSHWLQILSWARKTPWPDGHANLGQDEHQRAWCVGKG